MSDGMQNVPTQPSVPASAGSCALPRSLGLLDAVSMVVGIILGTGIFVAPASVARIAPSPAAAVGLWGLGAAVAACGALCYAECGIRLPHDGGFFVFFRHAFGWRWAFVAGWAALLISYPTSLAGVAVLGARYLGALSPALEAHPTAGAVFAITVAAALNAAGLDLGRWAQRFLTLAKVVAILSVLLAAGYAAWAHPAPPSGTVFPDAPSWSALGGAGALLQALAILMWTYDGWTDITMVAGEVRAPEKNLVRAVLLSLLVLFGVYAAVQVAVMLILGPAAAQGEQVLADALAHAFGGGGGRALGLLVALTALGSVHGVTFATSRLAWAMAGRGAVARQLARVSPHTGVPTRAVWGVWLLSCLYVCGGSFTELLEVFALVIWLFYGATGIALLRLRARNVGGAVHGVGLNTRVAPAVLLTAAVAMTALQVADSPARALGVLASLGLARLALSGRAEPVPAF